MIVVDVLVWLLVVIGVLLAVVLVMPIAFAAEGAIDEDDGVWWRVRVRWAFGFLALRADGDGMRLALPGHSEHPDPAVPGFPDGITWERDRWVAWRGGQRLSDPSAPR